jgi:hypothetical protein
MSQFDSYNEQPKSDLKETLKSLANSNMSDNEIRLILSQLSNQNKQPQYNSQFGDH